MYPSMYISLVKGDAGMLRYMLDRDFQWDANNFLEDFMSQTYGKDLKANHKDRPFSTSVCARCVCRCAEYFFESRDAYAYIYICIDTKYIFIYMYM